MKNRISLALFIAFLLILNTANAQNNDSKEESPFHFSASYTGDLVSNFSGGIKRGTVYLGLANLKAGFDTEKAAWWKGGEAFVNLGNTHGGEPSATLVGDFQGISNIEAGNHSFFYELWYKQSFKSISITIGLQDLNTNFAVSENGALFANSSFGIHSSIVDNVSPPIFPLTALGVNLKWNISADFLMEAAVFDGTPDDFSTNPYNTNWRLSTYDGELAIAELQYTRSLLAGKEGSYKVGAYFHQHADSTNVIQNIHGFYLVANQQLTSKLSGFFQLGISPKKMNTNNLYCGVGLNYTGLFSGRPTDQLGLAVAYAGLEGNSVGSETAIELTYKLQATKCIYIRPDIQYIINPARTNVKLNNALVGVLRFGVEF